jgi:hypothetical protein
MKHEKDMKRKFVVINVIGAVIMLFATLNGAAQTVWFKGGSCVLEMISEATEGDIDKNTEIVRSLKVIRAVFRYTLDEDGNVAVMIKTLFDKGLFVADKTKFKPEMTVFDAATADELMTKKNGNISLIFNIPRTVKIESIKFECSSVWWTVENSMLTVGGRGDIAQSDLGDIASVVSVIVEDSITGVGHHSFAMSKISSCVLGKSISKIGTYAFFNCDNLVRMELRCTTPPKVGAFAFMMTPVKNAKLIVPAGTKAAYEKSKDWKKFGVIEESIEN